MKRILIAILIVFSMAYTVSAQTGPTGATGATGATSPPPPPIPDVNITTIIRGANQQRVKDGFFIVYPIPDNDNDGNPDYTMKLWLKIKIGHFIKATTQEGESRLRHKAADNNINNNDVTE